MLPITKAAITFIEQSSSEFFFKQCSSDKNPWSEPRPFSITLSDLGHFMATRRTSLETVETV